MYVKWKVRNIHYQDQSVFVKFSKRKFREFKLLIMDRKYLSTETVLSFRKEKFSKFTKLTNKFTKFSTH